MSCNYDSMVGFRLPFYPTTSVIVSMSVFLYAIFALACFITDRRSPVQEKIIPVQDNNYTDRQRYIITLETGSEPGSGTTAKVHASRDIMCVCQVSTECVH